MSLHEIVVCPVEAHGRASKELIKTYVRMSLRKIVVYLVEAHGRVFFRLLNLERRLLNFDY